MVGEDVLGGLGHHLHTRVTFLCKKYILKEFKEETKQLIPAELVAAPTSLEGTMSSSVIWAENISALL